MRKKTKDVFVTVDGREFEDRERAKKHESYLKNTKKGGIPVVIMTCPDLVEGRHGPREPLYGIVYVSYNRKSKAKKFATLYATQKIGPPSAFCMGVFGGNAIMDRWKVRVKKWEDFPLYTEEDEDGDTYRKELDFIVVDRFSDTGDFPPHKDKFDEEAWRESKK